MSYDRLRFECRHRGCIKAFLTVDARNGHESVHADETSPPVIGGETP